MDDEDRATLYEENERAAALNLVRHAAAGLKPCGACHYCGEVVRYGLFCAPVDSSGDGCARDYEAQQAARRRNGMH